MSDLCHNCGDCHLGAQAVQCQKELQKCIICNCYGHTYNFCPKSVHQLDEKYSYFMLCHNCDSWHLPKPCDKELKLCERCQQRGHMEFFCPVDPEPRSWTNEQVGTKRQRNQDGRHDMMQPRVAPAVEEAQIHPQLLRHIKLHAVTEAIQLLKGYSQADVLQYFARPVLPPLQTMMGSMQHTEPLADQQYEGNNTAAAHEFRAAAAHPNYNTFNQRASQATSQQSQGSPIMLPTPASATDPQTTAAQEQPASGVYQTMHDRFERGELAMAQDMQEPRSDSVTQSPAADSADADYTPADKKKKATPKPRRTVTRCAQCKKRHMRCTHFDENGNAKVPGVQPANSSINELPSVMHLVCKPSAGHLMSREEQDTIRVGNGQKKMSEHIAATDQSLASELPAFDETRGKYQGGTHQLDWLDKSKEHAQSAFVMGDPAPAMISAAAVDAGNDQPWNGGGGMSAASGMYGDQTGRGEQTAVTDQQIERNLAQMLSEEAGFGLAMVDTQQSHIEPMTFTNNASVAFMGAASPLSVAAETDVAHADGVGTPGVDAPVGDLIEPPKRKRGGGRKRSKVA